MKKGFDRTLFPFFVEHPETIYVDNGATTQRLGSVIDAELRFYRSTNAPVHRGVYELAEKATEVFEKVRGTVANFVGAAHESEIVFVRGTTEGTNTVAHAWAAHNLTAGDEIVITALEHHANCVPWIELAHTHGFVLKWIGLDPAGNLQLEGLDTIITSKTKLVSLTASSNVIGQRVTFEPIIARAKAVGARVLLDAAQAIAHRGMNVQELGCDFMAFSSHKMYGPTGVGVLYVRQELHSELKPFQVGGGMIEQVTQEGVSYQKMPTLLEAGTPSIAQVVALGAAVEFFLTQVKWEELEEHEHALAAALIKGLRAYPKVHIVGDADKMEQHSHLVSFYVEGMHAHDVAAYCGSRGVCIRAGRHCAQPLHDALGVDASARISFAGYNTLQEVERILEVLGELLS